MALFVVICGALLMIGGAVSLLMGFDIVMTERGAAMAIGGTVALAGGVVAVGIGGVLLRLSQILRALEQRQPKAKASVPDRPVIAVKRPDDVEAVPPPAPAVSSPGATGLAAGAAAAGLAAAGAVALGREASPAEVIAPVVDEPLGKAANPVLQALKDDVRAVPPVREAQAPLDLEEELARALAELDEPTTSNRPAFNPPAVNPAIDEATDFPPVKAGRRRRSWASRKEPEPAADAEVSNEAGSRDEAAHQVIAEADVSDKELAPVSEPDIELDMAQLDPAQLGTAQLGTAQEPEIKAEEAVSDEAPDAAERPSADDDLMPTPSKPKVLGTYNVGGRTYSMYADGSVEAMTEFGVERFASMDDLRKHLMKT